MPKIQHVGHKSYVTIKLLAEGTGCLLPISIHGGQLWARCDLGGALLPAANEADAIAGCRFPPPLPSELTAFTLCPFWLSQNQGRQGRDH